MTDFKLLAIRPLKGCNPDFLKNLKADQFYQFYQNYTFNVAKNGQVDIVHKSDFSEGLYTVKQKNNKDLLVNISAIVGENGSGKSSLMELLFVSVYLLAVQENVIGKILQLQVKKWEREKKRIEEYLESLLQSEETFSKLFKAKIPRKISDEYFVFLKSHRAEKEAIIESINKNLSYNKSLSLNTKELQNTIHLEIYYQLSGTCFNLKIIPGSGCKVQIVPSSGLGPENPSFLEKLKVNTSLVSKSKSALRLSDYFFYSVALNYSFYALNSRDIGEWITALFHKNDGYQTPLVINPMRDEGNIDVNIENHLVRSRLLANIFSPLEGVEPEKSIRCLTKNKVAAQVSINLDKGKFTWKGTKIKYDYWERYGASFWPIIHKVFFSDSAFRKSETKWDKAAKEYILRKLEQMAEKYPPYWIYLKVWNFGKDVFEKYLIDLKNDDSHIAFKFHQAINYLKYDYATDYVLATSGRSIEEISKKVPTQNKDIINYVPPSFLKVDIIFSKGKDAKSRLNSFSKLSSGEKQKIYSISSIVYHLRYLDSVKVHQRLGNKYKFVNLIFDEIELYYHPELQRNFVNDLLQSLKSLKLKYIESVNCQFITHSPFILSDIPKTNVLYLIKEPKTLEVVPKELATKTFGANIHELLNHSFFMQSTTGQFASEEINDMAKFFYTVRLGGDMKELRKQYLDKRDRYIYIKEIVGEKIIEGLLSNHIAYLDEKFELKPVNQ